MIPNTLATQARQASRQLVAYLSPPNLHAIATRAGISLPHVPIFGATATPPMVAFPTAAFDALGPLTGNEVPNTWGEAHAHWANQERDARLFRSAFVHWGEASAGGRPLNLNCVNPLRAAALLLGEGIKTDLGRALFGIATREAFPAFIAAHVPGLSGAETEQVLETLRCQPEFLFWLGYQQPALRDACFLLGSTGNGLFASLAAANTTSGDWAAALADEAEYSKTASSAALILFPAAPTVLHTRWVDNVLTDARLAYETARWTMRTWHGGAWLKLRNELREAATGDRGRLWMHWGRDVERPHGRRWAGANALWAFELSLSLGMETLPVLLRNRLWRKVIKDRTDLESTLLLRWCQRHREN